ncbi:MAG: hypothetical protein K9G11_01950 [Rickettsiaceae bacterium]|nr:hypothetical protein [Rickettsiaceae bacterium]
MTITEVTYTTEVNQFLLDLSSLDDDSFALKYKELKVLDLNRALKYKDVTTHEELLAQLCNKLKYLTQLKTLDLSHNNISYTDLSSLSALKELEEINISHNHLKAKGAENIVKALLNSKNTLKTLELNHCSITSYERLEEWYGEGVKELFEDLGKLTELEVLNLSNNTIGIKNLEFEMNNLGVDYLAKALVNLTKLKILNLSNNHLKEDSKSLLDALKQLSSTLEGLNLSANSIAGPANEPKFALNLYEKRDKPNGEERAKYLVETLSELKNLKILYLDSNKLKKHQVVNVVDALIGSGAPLEELDLGSNNAGKEGANSICKLLLRTPSLKKLDISRSHLGKTGASNLFTSLATNKTLEELDINFICDMSENSASKQLINAMKQNKQSKKSDMSENSLSKQLSNAIKQNKSLKILNISSNKINDDAAINIACGLNDNGGLKSLYACNNNIGFEGAGALVKSCKKIDSLILSGNGLNHGNFTDLLDSIKNIKLKVLDLSNIYISITHAQAIAESLHSSQIKKLIYDTSSYGFNQGINQFITNAVNAHEEFNNLFENDKVISPTNFFEFLLKHREYLKNPFAKQALLNPSLWENECDETPKFFVKELLFREAIQEFDKKIDLVREQLLIDLEKTKIIEEAARLLDDEHKFAIMMHSYESYFNNQYAKLILKERGELSKEREEQTRQIENFHQNEFVSLKNFHGFDKKNEAQGKPLSIEFYVLSKLMKEENLHLVKSLNTGFDEETGICNNEDFVANTLKNKLKSKVSQKMKCKLGWEKFNAAYCNLPSLIKLTFISMESNPKGILKKRLAKERPAEDTTSYENNSKRQKLCDEDYCTKQKPESDNMVYENQEYNKMEVTTNGHTEIESLVFSDQMPQ